MSAEKCPKIVLPQCQVEKILKGQKALMTLVPYRRIGEPEDIGRAAVWLASDHADYVNGTSLFVDGGMTLYPGFATGG